MKEYALYYASLNWYVFPVYEMEGDNCSCGRIDCTSKGKHPRLKDGLHAATIEEGLISAWWDIYPNANIGIRTGEISGFLVVDIDGDGELPERMPDTVCQTTGSGGQHLLYKYPSDGFIYKSGTHIYPSVDSRSDGGYIVATPSNHKSGGVYSWDIAPNEMELSECPKFWLDKIRKEVRSQEFESGEAVTETDDRIDDMLKVIDPDVSYSEWVNIGMAIHSGTNGDGFTSWNNWSMRGSKYGGYEYTRNKWDSFSGNGISISTLSFMARENGWIDPLVEHGKMIAAAILKSEQMKFAERIAVADKKITIKPPIDLVPKKGVIRELYNHINDTAQYRQPELALGSILCFIATIGGRKYSTVTNATTNLYMLGVAPTGTGKDHARKKINDIAASIGASNIVSNGSFASSAAIITALSNHPCQLMMIDEFGSILDSITSKNAAGHVAKIAPKLMECSTGGRGSYIESEARADTKMHPAVKVASPHLTIYGTTTPTTLFNALSSTHIHDGLLNRFLIVQPAKEFPDRVRGVDYKPVPNEIIEKCKAIFEYQPRKGNLAGSNITNEEVDFYDVKITDEARALYEDYTDYIYYDLRQKNDDNGSLYARASENAMRLALVYAISIDHIMPCIDKECIEWAMEFAMWCTNNIINESAARISSSDYERMSKEILMIIKKHKKGITHTEFSKLAKKYTTKDRNAVLLDLIDREEIKKETMPTATKAISMYFYTGE